MYFIPNNCFDRTANFFTEKQTDKWKFDRLRKEEPEKYESYSDMKMNSWIRMKIVVKGQEVRLYLDNNKQPSIVVLDMKHGAKNSGSIGLWVGPGTEGFFKNLKVTKQ